MLRLSKLLNLCIFVASIKHICKEYHKRICTLEGEKIDSEYEVARKALEARIDFLILLLIDPPFWTRARLCLRPPSCLEEIKQIELRTQKKTQKHIQANTDKTKQRCFAAPQPPPFCLQRRRRRLSRVNNEGPFQHSSFVYYYFLLFLSLSSAAIFSHCISYSLASLSLPLWMLNLK